MAIPSYTSNNSNKLMFTAEQLKEIDACSHIQEIFRQPHLYLGWDHRPTLTAILDKLDSVECEELFGNFKAKLTVK